MGRVDTTERLESTLRLMGPYNQLSTAIIGMIAATRTVGQRAPMILGTATIIVTVIAKVGLLAAGTCSTAGCSHSHRQNS
jgi:hypothetical protein